MNKPTTRILPAAAATLAVCLWPAATSSAHSAPRVTGHVYQTTNASGGNAVQVFDRTADGRLSAGPVVSTGGAGTGEALHSQGGLVREGDLLFAVNAGSDTVSALQITDHGLALRGIVPTGGDRPVSVTVKDGLGYVVNQGSDTLTGFRYTPSGHLAAVPYSTRALRPNPAGGTTDVAQVQFTPSGSALLVTEKAANRLETFPLRRGWPLAAVQTPSAGTTPYGFDFTRNGDAVVSEATTGSASSYEVTRRGARVVTAAAPTQQAAACWVVIRSQGRVAYVVNAASGTVSSFRVSHGGALSLIDPAAATTGPGGTDAALSADQRYLTVRMSAAVVSTWAVSPDGSLASAGTATGSPTFGNAGLAAD